MAAAAQLTDDFLDIKLVSNKANGSKPLTWLPCSALLPFSSPSSSPHRYHCFGFSCWLWCLLLMWHACDWRALPRLVVTCCDAG
jgi:hypothetical protein